MAASMLSSTAGEGLNGRKALSSKVLQMKFMQRRDEPTAAAQQSAAQPSSGTVSAAHAAHQWTTQPRQPPTAQPAATATATATAIATSIAQSRILILQHDDDTTPPAAFIAGRRSFGRNKALERTLAEVRGAGQAGRAIDGSALAQAEERKESEEDEEAEEKDNRAVGQRVGRGRSEGRQEPHRRGGRQSADARDSDKRKRRATMSVAEMGREEQRRKKQQRIQDGFRRPAD